MSDSRYLLEYIGEPAMLEQLAEEACELAQACLKTARILRGENPTPVSIMRARANLKEEFTDVILCADQLKIDIDDRLYDFKLHRFEDRVLKHSQDKSKEE